MSSFRMHLLLGVLAFWLALSPLSATDQLQVPIQAKKLKNGLKVVISPDPSVATVCVGVYYGIGMRIEPKDRTGFAHLFEHMMFQGSKNLGKMEFIRLVQANGGLLNGSTRMDYTNYFEIMPAYKLETALWAEADRMRGLDITQENLSNQQGVVKNEVKVNVLNAPYGGFPWLDMPQYANTNWYNAHNFYGDLADLDAANLADVQQFFKTYYAPNNAVLVMTGGVNPEEGFALASKYFEEIPQSQIPPVPDISEPKQTEARRATKDDPYATQPALAFAYHMPARDTDDYFAMALLDQILLQGNDSILNDILSNRDKITSGAEGGINLLGNMFNYKGPMLWIGSFIHDSGVPEEKIVAAIDEAIAKVTEKPVDAQLLARAKVKWRSNFYSQLDDFSGFGLADILACFALFDDQPQKVNQLEAKVAAISAEQLQKTAREYLRPTNRTLLILNAKAAPAATEEKP